jgi:hypothetical protein
MNTDFFQFLRGSAQRLNGHLLVVAQLETPLAEDHPASGMVVGNLVGVEGNYRELHTMADFFRKELGLTMESGIEEVIEQSQNHGGLEAALDPEQVRERLRSMGNSEFMPIPAKVVPVESLEQAKEFDGDVIFLGVFAEFQFAHMAINAIPLLYQARYREQERQEMRSQIDDMLSVLSSPSPLALPDIPTVATFSGDLEQHLLRELLPGMFYAPDQSWEYHAAEKRFRAFMAPYLYPNDVEQMMELVPRVRAGEPQALHRLELLVRKSVALQREDFRSLDAVRRELDQL